MANVASYSDSSLNDPGTYLPEFCALVDRFRTLTLTGYSNPVDAIEFGGVVYANAADGAIAGFEAAIPAPVAAALYVQFEGFQHARQAGVVRRLLSRRGRTLAGLYETASMMAAPMLAAHRNQGLEERFATFMLHYTQTRHAPRFKAIAEQVAAQMEEDEELF